MQQDDPIITVGPSLPSPQADPPPPIAKAALLLEYPQAHRDSELIPEPPHGRNRSYTGFIRPDDLPKYIQAKDIIKRLVRNILNINVSWRFQDGRSVERLRAKILRQFPMFKDYDQAWPVMYFAYQKLGDFRRCLDWKEKGPMRRRVSARIRNKQPCPRCSGGVQAGAIRASGYAVVQDGVAGTEAGLASNAVATADERAANDRQRSPAHIGRVNAPSGSSNATGAHSFSRPDHSSEGHKSLSGKRLAAMIELAKQDEKDVLDFLCGISGTFAYLLDRFRVAGLTSRARLVAMAGWNAVDVDAFLISEVRLSGFERKAVSVALGKLVG
ncbi:hypothetical protein C8Q70DRAFT_1050674 [Cubamyces menziesii]|nr:hypothetical protein C8Q70DRAFT_1050674 [Cubamyces menziesii]